MSRPLLLDLFSGAGGCARGYHDAGFDVLGVDRRPMPRYPHTHVVDDAMALLERLARNKTWRGYRARDFAAIHASPPRQRYSRATFCRPRRNCHADLIVPAREFLLGINRPWVIENVEGSPLARGIVLCGLMFGLLVFRHRVFESSHVLLAPSHVLLAPSHLPHGERRIGKDGFACLAGHGGQLTGWAGSGTRRTVPRVLEQESP